MADRCGQSVGCIEFFDDLRETEDLFDHPTDLLFFSATVADKGEFDLHRCVGEDGDLSVENSDEGDTTGLSEFESGLGVGGKEDIFEGSFVGLILVEDELKFVVDLFEAFVEGLASDGDATVGQMARAARVHLDHAPASDI